MIRENKNIKKYLICGYYPHPGGGVARLLNNIIPKAKKSGFKYISIKKESSFKDLLSDRKYFQIIL